MNENNFLTIKTKEEITVQRILNKETNIEVSGINVMADNLKIGTPIFIVLGGDKPNWDTGLIGIAEVSKEPYDIGYEKKNFRIQIDMKILLSEPITREQLVPYRGTYGIIGIGPVLKGEPNQALTSMSEEQEIALLRAMLEISPVIEEELLILLGSEKVCKILAPTKKLIELDIAYGEKIDYAIKKVENATNLDYLFSLNNKEFAMETYRILDMHDAFDTKNLAILTENGNKRLKNTYPILCKLPMNCSIEEKEKIVKDDKRRSRYYPDELIINDEKYVITNNWYYKSKRGYDTRTPYVEWIMEVIEKNRVVRKEPIKNSMENVINYSTGFDSAFERNRIIFGAPGTGKSFTINQEKEELLGEKKVNYERVTFHPDYSYANFVGTYKPVPDEEGITYKYVPGPFMRTLVKSLKSSRDLVAQPYLLIIEEINRANVAAVFGDVFQLLDRDKNGVSEYPIQASEDIKKYLAEELGGKPSDYNEIRIPNNMFIWASMNSADQGVFPMDTAFKRRWDFTYIGINDSEEGIAGKTVKLGSGDYECIVEWNQLRKAINKELLSYKVNEDKLMGPYFISKKVLGNDSELDAEEFIRVFKNKVIMYLFDDAAKQKRPTLFAGCEEKNLYSAICKEFDLKGIEIFCESIKSQFKAKEEE